MADEPLLRTLALTCTEPEMQPESQSLTFLAFRWITTLYPPVM